LEKELEELQKENKEKDDAIFELGQFYNVRYYLIIFFIVL